MTFLVFCVRVHAPGAEQEGPGPPAQRGQEAPAGLSSARLAHGAAGSVTAAPMAGAPRQHRATAMFQRKRSVSFGGYGWWVPFLSSLSPSLRQRGAVPGAFLPSTAQRRNQRNAEPW